MVKRCPGPGLQRGGRVARLQTRDQVTESAVVGIGLNVEQSPPVERGAFVPRAAALSDFTPATEACSHPNAFPRLLKYLGLSLEILEKGDYSKLLETYRQHSIILGRRATIFEDHHTKPDGVIARGFVESIGPSLELKIEGLSDPVTKGRLRLDN